MIDLDKFRHVMELVQAHGDCELKVTVNAYEGVRYLLIQDKDTEECRTFRFTTINGLTYILNKLISEK